MLLGAGVVRVGCGGPVEVECQSCSPSEGVVVALADGVYPFLRTYGFLLWWVALGHQCQGVLEAGGIPVQCECGEVILRGVDVRVGPVVFERGQHRGRRRLVEVVAHGLSPWC